MKRSVLLLTAAAVALSPLAATAAPAKAKPRTLTYEYSGFSGASASGAGFNYDGACAAADACWDFSTQKGEKTIEFTVSDASAGIQVFYDDAYADNVVTLCGSGKVTVSQKTTHLISVRPALSECGSVPTSGTITAVLTPAK